MNTTTIPILDANQAEVARQMQICNACRYCEGFCAVFPAMTRRLEFGAADIGYLANLCHNCGACLHACQYAPPHEFKLNVPQAMARVRADTYAHYAWPAPLGALYRRNGLALALVTAAMLALFLALGSALAGGSLFTPVPGGNFYAVFGHNLLAWMFGIVFLAVLVALGVGAWRFWRVIEPAGSEPVPHAHALAEATGDALLLRYLDGGHGEGCNEESDRYTLWRRRFHHATFYGFLLCLAATAVGTLYHFVFGWHAPYAHTSLPVILGSVGGLGLIVGPIGLLWLNVQRPPEHGDAAQRPMDRVFALLLLLVSVSGMALLGARATGAMALLLAVHLGLVMALFLTLPYGKFAHSVYRCAALLKNAREKRRPNRLTLGGD